MKTQTIKFDNGEVKARIVISEATTLEGQRRSRLAFEARQYDNALNNSSPENNVDLFRIHQLWYPAAVGAATSIEINGKMGDPSLEEFQRLPDALTWQWIEFALDLNPHWFPVDDDQKKESSQPTSYTAV